MGQAAMLSEASALLGVCGAALANALFLRAGMCMVELFLRFQGMYAKLAAALGLRHLAWPPEATTGEDEGEHNRGRGCGTLVIGEEAAERDTIVCRAFLPSKRRD